MRKYLSAGDNSIRILCNFLQYEKYMILSSKNIYEIYPNWIKNWIKQKNVAFSIFPIGINDLSYRENIFPMWIILLPKE
jgi:hypothetical protein